MLEEVMDLSTGLGVALMPVLLLAVPGIVLFVLLPAILLLVLAAPFLAIGALIAALRRLSGAIAPRPRSGGRRRNPSVAPWRA
jgi:hypothetical protein